jgi:hypothetical protein
MRALPDENARLRRVLGSAAGDFINLVVAGSSVIAALAAGSWGLLLLGGAIYVLLTAWKASSPSFWQKVLAAESTRPRLPDPTRIADVEVRKVVSALHAGRAEVQRVLATLPDDLQPHLTFTSGSLTELETCASQIVARSEELTAYLRTVNRDAILAELRRIDDQVRRVHDEGAQLEYASAQQARQDQLAVLDQLGRVQERLFATLQRLLAIVEGLPARMVRLRVLNQETHRDLSAELDEEILRVNEEMLTAEHSLRALTIGSELLPADATRPGLLLGMSDSAMTPDRAPMQAS